MADNNQIGNLDKADEYQKDNEFIRSGYRIKFNSTRKIFRSLFMLHNESVNVWSHLVGVFIFMVLIWHAAIALGLNTSPNQIDLTSLQSNLSNTYTRGLERIGEYGFDLKQVYKNYINWDTFEEIGYDIQKGYETGVNQIKETAIKFSSFCDSHFPWSHHPHSNSTTTLVESIHEQIDQLSHSVTQMCHGLKNQLDSQKYDWIDPLPKPQSRHHVSRWPLFVFLISAIICLGCSATFHLFNARSHFVNQVMSRVDYAGISFLISGSFYPLIYYIFFCYDFYIYLYLISITIACLLVFIMAMTPRFQDNDMRSFRGFAFLAVGLLGVIPSVHIMMLPEINEFKTTIVFCLLMGLSYICGVLIYVSRIPERFYPGRFDIWGHSHQIWHFFVLMAAVLHYVSSIIGYHVRMELECKA